MEPEMFFEREERYIVIKRKYLTTAIESNIRDILNTACVSLTTAVVVEEDWPEYEIVWKMLEERFIKTPENNPVLKYNRPDYSPRELRLLREHGLKSHDWVTNESKPRRITILGKSSLDPDVYVIKIEGDTEFRWLMACGNESYDGNIIGTDIWIRET